MELILALISLLLLANMWYIHYRIDRIERLVGREAWRLSGVLNDVEYFFDGKHGSQHVGPRT